MNDKLAVRFYENNILSEMKKIQDRVSLLEKLSINTLSYTDYLEAVAFLDGGTVTHTEIDTALGKIGCGFLAYNSATVNSVTGDNTVYTIIFNTEVADIGGNYNNANGIFTAPHTGFYVFNTNALFRAVSSVYHSELDLDFVVSGTSANTYKYARIDIPASVADFVLSNTSIIYMTATDTVLVKATGYGSSKAIDIYGTSSLYTRFSGVFIG